MLTTILFLGTNLAILVMLSLSMKLLGIEPYLAQQGVQFNLQSLLIFAALFGMLGSIISLLISKWTARRMLGLRVLVQPETATEAWLVETVQRQAAQAGIGNPEVAIFESPQANAFATGANRNNALVAVSTGLLKGMQKNEVEAVLGHEISHVANGDMLRLALIQGVVNTFVIFVSRVVGHVVDRVVFRNQRGTGPGYWITTVIAELVFGLLATMIVMWFSRRREFRADSGGAALAGRAAMISALERLQSFSEPQGLPNRLAAFGVSGRDSSGFRHLLMSHPPLAERIEALQGASFPHMSSRNTVIRRR